MAFSSKQVCQITGVSPRQLRYWAKTGLVKASASTRGGKRPKHRYNLRDILIVLVVKDLRNKGLSLQRIRRSVTRVQKLWGNDHPLASLRVACLAQSVVFRKDGQYVDALTGQQVFDIALQKIRSVVGQKRCIPTERMLARAAGILLQRVSEM